MNEKKDRNNSLKKKSREINYLNEKRDRGKASPPRPTTKPYL